MSAATATLIAGGLAIAGTLLGVAFGQWLEDRRRRRGEVVREVRAWSGSKAVNTVLKVSESRLFEVRFFNDRDVNISLWDPLVEVYRGNELIGSIPPHPPGRPNDEVRPIDLASRTSVYVEMMVEAEDEMISIVKGADRLEFVATTIPGRERVRKSLPTWDALDNQ